jgi:phosphoribosylglycinamide formyltransferase-1
MALKLAVLISGKGSNLAAVQEAIDASHCDARIALVVSDREGAAGLEFARARGLPTKIVSLREHPDRDAWDRALTTEVATSSPDLVVFAGFMRLVGKAFLERFARRVINVHPALLPCFPGTDGPGQALRAGVRVSGCTVHVVDSGVDTGPIIAQAAVPVLPSDDAHALHTRIQRAEHMLLPLVIDAIARGAIVLEPELRIVSVCDASELLLLSPPLPNGST